VAVNPPSGYDIVLTNLTTSKGVHLTLTPPAGVTFMGNSIEWIYERPGVLGGSQGITVTGFAPILWAQAFVPSLAHGNGERDYLYTAAEQATGILHRVTYTGTQQQGSGHPWSLTMAPYYSDYYRNIWFQSGQ
jgi:hypothetical protein